MSTKQAASVALGLAGVAFLFAFVYVHYTGDKVVGGNQGTSEVVSPTAMAKKPVTPDTATADIINQAGKDAAALDNVEKDELSNLDDTSNNVNDLSTVYDDKTAQ